MNLRWAYMQFKQHDAIFLDTSAKIIFSSLNFPSEDINGKDVRLRVTNNIEFLSSTF